MQDKDEQLLKKRISELAALCYQRDIRSYTDFLTLNEQTIFHSMKRTLPPVTWLMGGGYETAERKIVCFCRLMRMKQPIYQSVYWKPFRPVHALQRL